MSGLRGRLRRLEDAAEEEIVTIPQKGRTTARFPQSAGMEAFMNVMDRLEAGEDAPPEHPLIKAARNFSDPRWIASFFALEDPERWIEPVDDLSE